jgi:hypothetical protein
MFRLPSAVLFTACLSAVPAAGAVEDNPLLPRERLAPGILCTSPKDHNDCLEACAARLKEFDRYRACTAACTRLYCPRN